MSGTGSGWHQVGGWQPHRPPWADGYPTDTPYTDEVVVELNPTWLSTAAVLHGQPPLTDGRALTWLDVGCGTGLTAVVVAASNPDVDVWGFDYNPAHVERAQRLADRAGLANCHFREASFARLAADATIGPRAVDVVAVNGVYSWVSVANQRHITEVVSTRLRPGGLAYVMYETPTGWSSAGPLAEALSLHAAADGRPGHVAFGDAATAVVPIVESSDMRSRLGPREAKQVGSWTSANPFYAAHEYLGEHFGPLMLDEVAGAMADARCAYVGGIDATDHIPHYWAPPQLADQVMATTDPILREMLRDLIGQRPLRRDLFRRGLSVPRPSQYEGRLRALKFVGLGRPFEPKPIDLFSGQITLDPAFHQPLTEALATGPLDVDGVLAIHREWDVADAAAALALQVAAGLAAPLRPDAASRAGAARLNRALAAENAAGADHAYVAAPLVGGAVVVDSIELLAFGAVWDGATEDVGALVDVVWSALGRHGRVVREEGALVEDEAEARPIVERRVASALTKLHGVLADLGVE